MKLRFQLPRPRNPFRRDPRNPSTRHDSPLGVDLFRSAMRTRHSHGLVNSHAIDVSNLSPSRSTRRTINKAQRTARRRHSNLINHRRHHPHSR